MCSETLPNILYFPTWPNELSYCGDHVWCFFRLIQPKSAHQITPFTFQISKIFQLLTSDSPLRRASATGGADAPHGQLHFEQPPFANPGSATANSDTSCKNHSYMIKNQCGIIQVLWSMQKSKRVCKNHSEWAEITATGSKLDANHGIFQALRSMQKSMRLAKITAGEQKSKRRGQNSTRNRSRMKHEQIDRRPGYDASRFDIPIAVFA